MKIQQVENLNESQLATIRQIWNDSYPINLELKSVNDLKSYLNSLNKPKHFLAIDSNKNILGWAAYFKRDNAIWFIIIVSQEAQEKGLGTMLLNELKKGNSELNGWVIDHPKFKKSNGQYYKSPLKFYQKKDFQVLPNEKFSDEKISVIKIHWNKTYSRETSIIPAKLSDIPGIQKVFVESILNIDQSLYNFEQLQDWASCGENSETWNARITEFEFYLFVRNREILGFISFDNNGYIDTLFVSKNYQRQGIAQSLFDFMLKNSTARVLSTNVSKAAKPFFEKNGFAVDRKQTIKANKIKLDNYKMTRKRKL